MRGALLALLAACAVDTDGDGLSDREEARLGFDPHDPDMDRDGLDDGGEHEWASDPRNPDTDDDRIKDGPEVRVWNTHPLWQDSDLDGYRDGEEVQFGSNPDNAISVIYLGGWPYWYDKDALGWPEYDGELSVGEPFPRVLLRDESDQKVDLYDFGGPEVPDRLLVVAVSLDCDCWDWDHWYSELSDAAWDKATKDKYRPVKRDFDFGRVGVVGVLIPNADGRPLDDWDLDSWSWGWRRDWIIATEPSGVVADATARAFGAAGAGAILDAETMTVEVIGTQDQLLDALLAGSN